MRYFDDTKFTYDNLDVFIRRRSIYKSLNWALPFFGEDLLDIGCGKMPYKLHVLENSGVKKYVGLDIENALVYDDSIKPDYTWDGKKMPFEDSSFNTAFGTEVLEHCPEPETVLAEVYRVIKKEGVFFFTVPFIWNLHEVPHDEFRYTPFSLKRLLENAGFKDVELYTSGGWNSYLAQATATWIKRSGLSFRKKKILSFLLKPVIKFLYRKDENKTITFRDGQMIIDIYGIAKK